MCYNLGLCSCSAPRGCAGLINWADLHHLLLTEEDDYFTTKYDGPEVHQLLDAKEEDYLTTKYNNPELHQLFDAEEDDYFPAMCDSPEVHKFLDAKEGDYLTTKYKGPELHQLFDADKDDYFATKCAGPTTVMVRNISYKYSTDDVREQLHELGFEGAYDFIYVPSFGSSGTKKGSNFGYFFLNLVTQDVASSLTKLLRGAHFGSSTKLCEVSPAEWQGLAELRAHFHKKRVTKGKASNRPIFL